ncbi:MAG: flagellar biosynthesis protein P, partial [Myxococcales bacterium]|nr:flagellar biosynthesis protein P [Myxococcales bacterium]
DASSSMLNVNGGSQFGSMGQTGWDQAREAIAGDGSMLAADLGDAAAEDAFLFGLAVFGHSGEEKLMFQYGPCARENLYWALDPANSCELPGCTDPWGGPPITWTFKDGSIENPPAFSQQTLSHMPSCTGNIFCAGSGTYTNLGLQLIKNNQIQYHQAAQLPNALYPANNGTQYINILITDGQYIGYATDAQVQTELEAMANAGIVTWIIGFGDGVDTPQAIARMENMADWGSSGVNDYLDANNQAELEMALLQIIEGLDHDPCCVTGDCYESPEPVAADEPDPLPPVDTTGGDSTTDSTTDGGTSSDGTTDAGTGSDGTTDSTSSGSDTSSSDGVTESDAGTGTATAADEIDGGSDTGPGLDDGGDQGCNCSSDERPGPGAPVDLLLLGLLGLSRGRRRGS